MVKNYALISIALAILAGGVAAFGYDEVNHTVPVVMAAQAIPANQTVTPQDISVLQVPAAYAQAANLVSSPALVEGKMLSVPAVQGEQINLQMLNTASDLQAIINQYAKKAGSGYLATLSGNSAWGQVVQAGTDIAIEQGSVLLAPIHVIAVLAPSSGGGAPTWFVFVPKPLYTQFSQLNWNSTGTQILLYTQNQGQATASTTAPPSGVSSASTSSTNSAATNQVPVAHPMQKRG